MVKKRFITLAVAILAVVSVVGVGFAAWFFGTQSISTPANSNVFVTHASNFGSFSDVSNGTYYLKLDQSTDDGATTNVSLVTLDASNVPTDVTSLTAKWTIDKATYDELGDSGIGYAVNIYVKGDSSSNLNKYIAIAADTTPITGAPSSEQSGYTKFTKAVTTTAADVSTNKEVTLTLSLSDIFDWNLGAEPENFAEYQQMIIDLGIESATDDVTAGAIYKGADNTKSLIFEFVAYKK